MTKIINWFSKISIKSVISFITVLMFFIFIAIIIFKKTKIISVDTDVLSLIIGALLSRVGSIYDYHFGSSYGSADKNKIIQDMTKEGNQ